MRPMTVAFGLVAAALMNACNDDDGHHDEHAAHDHDAIVDSPADVHDHDAMTDTETMDMGRTDMGPMDMGAMDMGMDGMVMPDGMKH